MVSQEFIRSQAVQSNGHNDTILNKVYSNLIGDFEAIYSGIFGNDENSTFQQTVQNYHQNSQKKLQRKRLGQSDQGFSFDIQNPDLFIWVAKILVGTEFTELPVLVDTATDLFAIN